MHWVISGSFGPTDPTRAMLPFLFAASAVQAGDSVMLMLFHDAVLMAVDGVGKTLVPVGPPQPLRRNRWSRQGDTVGVQAVR
jgi:tRNA 2-thiouridine synthesizing protein D